jgi:hypothetical protein
MEFFRLGFGEVLGDIHGGPLLAEVAKGCGQATIALIWHYKNSHFLTI